MKMNHFIQYLLRAFSVITDLPIDKNNIYQCRHAEIMSELQQLILTHQNLDVPLNEETLKPFCEFLKKRFEFIHHSPLTFFVNKGPDNEKCWLLAKFISPHVNINFLKLLIPTLTMTDRQLEFTYLGTNRSRMFDFFIAEDGKTLIRRSSVLAHASKVGKLTYTYGDYHKELTDTEKNLVINYTAESRDYYQKILYDKINIRAGRRFYLQSLNQDKCRTLPEFGFGDAGDERLIIKSLESSKTFKEFISLAAQKIDRKNWENILQKIDIKFLTQLILNTNENNENNENTNLMMILKKIDFQMDDELSTRVAGLCALRLYWSGVRELQGDFTSSMGLIFGRWVAYSKEDKKEAVNVGSSFLLSNYPLTDAGLDAFLKEAKKEHVKGAMLERGSMFGIIFRKILSGPIVSNAEAIDTSAIPLPPPSLKLG
jgi:hypothetical protein